MLIQQHFAEIRSVTSEYSAIYTDDSKDGDRVALAAVFRQQVYSLRLPSASSIFSADANASSLPLLIRVNSWSVQPLFLTYWQLRTVKLKNPFILKIVEIYKSLVDIRKHVIFTWIPSYIGIHGNTVVNQEAKDALDDPMSNCSIPCTDFKPFIMKYILKRWQDNWDQLIHNKIHEKPLLARLLVLTVKIGRNK